MEEFVVYHVSVAQALADYRERYGCEPRTIITHPTVKITAPEAEGIPLEHNGGCLANEVWLPAPELQPAPLRGGDHAG
ncbi:MAG TPA: hypothetical protein PLQ85_02500 [Anaerolineae bacterium]|nr:hypothetical protein [Anaerolineae bacterium]HUM35721.1 hypothetical protein [Anaerolineae bacterium]